MGSSIDLPVSSNKHAWSQRFGAVGNDLGNALATDGNGNVYLTGEFVGTVDFGGGGLVSAGGPDIIVASYTSTGAHRWSKRFGDLAGDSGRGVAVDQSGNVYVTGNFIGSVDFGGGNLTSASNEQEIFVASFSSSGAHRWSKRFGGPGADEGRGVAVDQSGNVYVTGSFLGSVNFGGANLTSAGSTDGFLASFASNGVHRWSWRGGGLGSDKGSGVAVDRNGHLYFTGDFTGNADCGPGQIIVSAGGSDIVVVGTNSDGVCQWCKAFGGPGQDVGRAVAADASGNVYVTGDFSSTVDFGGGSLTSAGSFDLFMASFDQNGVHRWSKRFGDTDEDHGYGAAIDPAGNLQVTGFFRGTVDFGGGNLTSLGACEIFVASYTSTGVHRWSNRFGDPSSNNALAIAADNSAAVYVTGCFQGKVDFGGGEMATAGAYDIFLLRMSP